MMDKLMYISSKIKNNKNVYTFMKNNYSNIFGYGDIIINEYLDKLYNSDNAEGLEIKKYTYLIEDMYIVYSNLMKINL